jgi:putative sterol carrier protein
VLLENFVNIASGALNGQKAFMTGKLKVKKRLVLNKSYLGMACGYDIDTIAFYFS